MNNKHNSNNNPSEKIHTFNDFSYGDWICFLLPNNKKCVGIINEMIIPDKSNNFYPSFQSIEVINYIDEDGLSGSIKASELNKNQRIIGVDINSFFTKKFTLKNEIINKNESRKISKDFVSKTKLKRTGHINQN